MANGQFGQTEAERQERERVRQSGLAGIRAAAERGSRRLDMATRVGGLRTSGVSTIPRGELERGRLAQEAGLEGQLASGRLGDIRFTRQLGEREASEGRLLERRAQIQEQANRRLADAALRNALISGGLGVASGFVSRPKGNTGDLAKIKAALGIA